MAVDKKPSSVGKFMLKLLKTAGIVLALFLAFVLVFKNPIIKASAQGIGSSILGAKLSIGKFSWDVAANKIIVKDITIDHPQGYEKGVFVDIPEVVLQYDAKALSKGVWHMPLVLIDLKEMTVIKNNEGKLNVDALNVLHPEKSAKMVLPPFMIDELKLNVGQVIYKDYFNRTTPNILVYNINFKDKVVKNIDSAPKLVGAVIMQAMKHTAIQSAGMYAAAAVMGVGFLPGVVLGVIVAKDDVIQDFSKGYAQAFDACEQFIKERGQLVKSDRSKGSIEGKLEGTDVKIKVEKLSWFKTRITVSARKFMMPKREFAGGVLYQIGKKL